MNKISPLPKHVAVIVDGNRRWAKGLGQPAWHGHARGAKRVQEVSRAAVDLGIEFITFWGGSYNNLTKRSKREIKLLNEIYESWAKKALADKELQEKQVRVRFLGEWQSLLSKKAIEAMLATEKATRKHSRFNLTYMIGYNGDREMLSAINSIIKKKVGRVDEATLKANLWTEELPPVDLVIRTGGDPHLSTGFMMWDTRDALLHFSEKMWPAFTKKDFESVIGEFASKERRFGK